MTRISAKGLSVLPAPAINAPIVPPAQLSKSWSHGDSMVDPIPEPIPPSILKFVKECVKGTQSNRPYSDRSISLEEAYYAQVGKEYITGTGICLKLETGPLTKKDADKVAMDFSISDGNFVVRIACRYFQFDRLLVCSLRRSTCTASFDLA